MKTQSQHVGIMDIALLLTIHLDTPKLGGTSKKSISGLNEFFSYIRSGENSPGGNKSAQLYWAQCSRSRNGPTDRSTTAGEAPESSLLA